MQNLKDKVILITGATAGIGRALAVMAASKKAKLILCGQSQTKMVALEKELKSFNADYYAETFDITEEQKTIAFIQNGIKQFKQVDILINNAGANTKKDKVVDIQTADYEYMIKLNQISPFIVMREVFKDMKKRKNGRIINIMSSVCLYSNPGLGSYTASKDGFNGMTKIFRKEAAEEGVIVTAVYPGGVNTDFRPVDRPDYLKPETVAESIISLLEVSKDACVHELVLRPAIEKNY